MNASKRTLSEARLQELLASHAPRLERLAAGKIPAHFRGKIATEDVLQEVWIAAFRGRSCFRGDRPDAFERWMNTLVERKVIDACRAARARKRGGDRVLLGNRQDSRASVLDFFEQVVADQPTPSQEFSAKEADVALRIAIGTLPDERRQAIWLHHIEGWPVAEVAKHLNKSNSAVNSLLYNGVRQLRSKLRQASIFLSLASFEKKAIAAYSAECMIWSAIPMAESTGSSR
jgi:RNA polymerase sigma-70 factor (subfamily 1)